MADKLSVETQIKYRSELQQEFKTTLLEHLSDLEKARSRVGIKPVYCGPAPGPSANLDSVNAPYSAVVETKTNYLQTDYLMANAVMEALLPVIDPANAAKVKQLAVLPLSVTVECFPPSPFAIAMYACEPVYVYTTRLQITCGEPVFMEPAKQSAREKLFDSLACKLDAIDFGSYHAEWMYAADNRFVVCVDTHASTEDMNAVKRLLKVRHLFFITKTSFFSV